jgi:hypothetical protein
MSRQLSFEVLPADLFDSFIPDASRVSGLKGQVLAKVNDAGLLVGDWRIAANGQADITVSFSGAQIYDAPELSGYDFTIELPPRDFGFSANRISSEWTNLHTSVSERKIAVSHCSDNCLNETSYLETARGPSEAHRFEACYRWAVDTKEDLAFTVILQGLPMSAEQARSKPYMAADSAPAILLAEISIQFDLCGREVSVCGPKPVLFAENVELVRKKIQDCATSLGPGIKSIAWLFIEHEMVDLHSAFAFIKRAREGKISRPFISEAQAGISSQGHRRPFLHTSRPHDPATGRIQGLNSNNYSHVQYKFPEFLPEKFIDAFLVGLQQQLSIFQTNSDLLDHAQKRLAQSMTRNTWRKYESAWNLFENFLTERNMSFTCPIPITLLRQFAVWADSHRHLAPSTIKSYISALSKLQLLLGFEQTSFNSDAWLKAFLQGTENAKIYEPQKTSSRRAVTFDILTLIGHQITHSGWSEFSKALFGAVSLLAFWGSFRLGELLSTDNSNFDPFSALLWDDIVFRYDGSLLIHLKSTKTSKFPGAYIDLFPFFNKIFCPIHALKHYRELAIQAGVFDRFKAVFMLSADIRLTVPEFISCINKFLVPLNILGPHDTITGHSFRAGIPSSLSTISDPSIISDLKIWSRWTSDAYLLYLKLQFDQKKVVFQKLENLFREYC